MKPSKKINYGKRDYHALMALYQRQKWLIEKEAALMDLLEECSTSYQRDMILALLHRFIYLDSDVLGVYLKEIANVIVNESGFEEERVQVVALAYDDSADSGQKILDFIKVHLLDAGWDNFSTVNKIGKAVKQFKAGRDQIVLIDEFIGSGKTIKNRVAYLSNNIQGNFQYIVCVIAGIQSSCIDLESVGHKIVCPLLLKKGISDNYFGSKRKKMLEQMMALEVATLLDTNNMLDNFSLGYGKAEALYTLDENIGNTPNSVFPIFWWSQNTSRNKRNTVLRRFESGLK